MCCSGETDQTLKNLNFYFKKNISVIGTYINLLSSIVKGQRLELDSESKFRKVFLGDTPKAK